MDKAPRTDASAQEIYQLLVAGERVSLVHLFSEGPLVEFRADISALQNHLNVIKSRDKKLYEGLGMNFANMIIRVVWNDYYTGTEKTGAVVDIYLDKALATKKFSIVHRPNMT